MPLTQPAETPAVATVPISVMIPTRAREERLKETLEELMRCDPLPEEVLIHFDGEAESTSLNSNRYPIPVKTFHSEAQLGPGGSRNSLVRKASCEIVCSFDDDSYPADPDYFARVIDAFESLPDAGVISASIQTPGSTLPQAQPAALESRIFDGCAASLRRSAVLKTDGYVPLATAYAMEESDLSLQLSAAGYRIYRTGWLRVKHDTFDSREKTESFAKTIIKNQALLAYLRYPLIFAPVAVYQCFRRLLWAKRHLSFRQIGDVLGEIPSHLQSYKEFTHRQSPRAVLRYLIKAPLRKAQPLKTSHANLGRLAGDGSEPVADVLASKGTILYCQYTNPGAYPPLEHSSRILADNGWDILFLGVGMIGAETLAFPPHYRIEVRSLGSCPPGIRQKLHYIRYCLWVAWTALRVQPGILYCSDLFSCIPGLLASRLSKATIVYHEHDIPDVTGAESTFIRLAMNARRKMAKRADMIAPNRQRLDVYLEQTGRKNKCYCVWNCPRREEFETSEQRSQSAMPIKLVYHGTIVPDRLPRAILDAVAKMDGKVHLTIIGYTTIGSPNYDKELKAHAANLGIADQLEILPPISRYELMATCGEYDIGLALLPNASDDINTSQMIGASNKVYDYLSQGVPVLVPTFREWEEHIVEAGYGLSCEPQDPDSIARALKTLIDHPEDRAAMGRRGRKQIEQEWNYEAQFESVLKVLESSA